MILTRSLKRKISVLINTSQGKSRNIVDHNSITLTPPGETS